MMPYFAAQDMTKLYYEEQGKGQPVLLVHGWSGSHESMAAVVDILKERCRCITYDHRGHGVSDKPVGGYSIELCGGAHLKNTAQVGSFKIVSENGIAAGVRRIEALTGEGALAHYQAQEEEIRTLSALAKTSPDKLVARVEQILAEQKELAKELEKLKAKMGSAMTDGMLMPYNKLFEQMDKK